MQPENIVFTIFVIFTGAALLATLTLYLRQSMILAYILLGGLVGPAGLGLVRDTQLVTNIAEIGIVFLLYLLGLNLYPQKLFKMLQEALRVTLWSTLIFFALGFGFAWVFGLSVIDCLIVGAATTFSSTILGLKLLPTTALHHKHAGEIIISILLLQDLLAIVVLVSLRTAAPETPVLQGILSALIALPLLVAGAYLAGRYLLPRLLHRFDRIQEYTFLLAIGWCLGMAELASTIGLSYETGAFIAGVAVATNPISRVIAEHLKPLRDFFLVIFFFALGARLEVEPVRQALLPGAALAALVLAVKPWVFKKLLVAERETPLLSREIGFRMGQISEFSLLIALMAIQSGVLSEQASYLIQVATMLCFIGSSFLIVRMYPTPIAVSDRLRRD